jgi:hypothetical protein
MTLGVSAVKSPCCTKIVMTNAGAALTVMP